MHLGIAEAAPAGLNHAGAAGVGGGGGGKLMVHQGGTEVGLDEGALQAVKQVRGLGLRAGSSGFVRIKGEWDGGGAVDGMLSVESFLPGVGVPPGITVLKGLQVPFSAPAMILYLR